MEQFGLIGVFVKTVELSSFTRSASALGISTSSVSKSIARLESDLGVKLLERTTRNVGTTPDGMTFYRRCKLILRELEDARNELAATHATQSGRLRVTLPVSYGKFWIMPILNGIAKQFPDLIISTRLSDRNADENDEGFDVAIVIGEPPDTRLVTRKLHESRIVTAAGPGYLDEWGTPASPEDLVSHNCLTLLRQGRRARPTWSFQRGDEVSDHSFVKGNLFIDNTEALLDAAAQGVGIVQVPDYVALPYLKKGALVEILADFRAPGPPVWVLYASHRHHASRVSMFIDTLFASVDSLPGEAEMARAASRASRQPGMEMSEVRTEVRHGDRPDGRNEARGNTGRSRAAATSPWREASL
ncbi:MAG: LysR family transcriptional regulator [Cupriavidus sp.]|nr:MAG: LysR family transcriptional regulator [Cupriavidus sp.]